VLVPLRLPALIALAVTGVGCSQYASTDGPEHCGSVGEQIWGKDLNPHDVTCDVTVTGDLTIGPDTKVRFAANTMLVVQGSLHIEGTTDEPVVFESADAGVGWVGVWVRPWEDQIVEQRPSPHADGEPASLLQGQVSIDNLVISGAGLAPDRAVYPRPASLVVDRGPVHVAGLRIDDSRQCGLAVGEDGRFAPTSERIEVAESAQAGVCAHAGAISNLPEDLTLPEGKVIDVFGDRLTGRHTWEDRGTPYRITEDLTLAYADLTIGPGTDIQVFPDVTIQVGTTEDAPTYGDKQYRAPDGPLAQRREARLTVDGGSAGVTFDIAPIAGEDGRWDRLLVTGANGGNAEAVLNNVTFRGAGTATTANPATLHVADGATVTLNDVTLDNGGGAGIRIDDGATITEDSAGLTITGHAYSASAHPNGAVQLPVTGSTYTGNNRTTQLPRASGDYIYLDDGSFTRTGTMSALGVQYIAEGDLVVDDPDTTTTALTIEGGTVIRFGVGARFQAGTEEPVSLVVGDTAGEPVVFSLADTEADDPAWVGVELGSKLLAGSALSNMTISGAGQDGTFGAALEVLAPAVLVDGVTIDGSQHHGLLLRGTFAEGSKDLTISNSGEHTALVALDSVASLPEAGADLASNPEPFVKLTGTKLSKSGTWGDLGVPYFVDFQMYVGGEVDVADNAIAARLKVEPGTTLLFDDRGGLRTEVVYNAAATQAVPATIELVGTAEAPIIMTPRSTVIGWTGVVLTGDDLLPSMADHSTMEHVIIEYAGAVFAQAAVTFDDATANVANVTVRDSKRYGVALIDDAYVDDPLDTRVDTWDRDAYVFENNYTNCITDPELPCPDDPDLIDFRVFLGGLP
jgi:hypothetical protein